MTPTPLTGIDLLNCAQANAKEGLDAAAEQCGYGTNTDEFRKALQQAAQEKNITVESLSDLLNPDVLPVPTGEAIAPDSPSDL